MNSKILQSVNGPLLQITMTPFEARVVAALVIESSLGDVAATARATKYDTAEKLSDLGEALHTMKGVPGYAS